MMNFETEKGWTKHMIMMLDDQNKEKNKRKLKEKKNLLKLDANVNVMNNTIQLNSSNNNNIDLLVISHVIVSWTVSQLNYLVDRHPVDHFSNSKKPINLTIKAQLFNSLLNFWLWMICLRLCNSVFVTILFWQNLNSKWFSNKKLQNQIPENQIPKQI